MTTPANPSQEQSFEEWIDANPGIGLALAPRAIWENRKAHYQKELAEEQKLVLHYRREGQEYRDRIEYLEEMVTRGLGWEDMQDDH